MLGDSYNVQNLSLKKKEDIFFHIFFFNDTPTTQIYTLSLHDALPISSIKHAKERIIAGNPIGANQLIQSLITDMSLGVDTTRSFLYSAASRRDTNPPAPVVDVLKVKLYASESAIDVTNKAIQVHGGHGYCKDFPIERYYRDARGLTLHFKTSELLKAEIGKITVGL